MPLHRLSPDEFRGVLADEFRGTGTSSPRAGRVLVVDLDALADHGPPQPDAPLDPTLPAVVVGTTTDAGLPPPERRTWCDIVLPDSGDGLDEVVDTVETNPIASAALVMLLRGADERSLDDGLLLESAVYSTLQAGPEFRRWLDHRAATRRVDRRAEHRPDRAAEDSGAHPPLELERDGSALRMTLARPHVRNALNAELLQELLQAFRLVALDPTITEVHLDGAGPSFCAGGDLDEFGSFTSPAEAHLVRLDRSVGRAIAAVADRVTVHLHGACAGSGIELPAFAGTIVADATTTISLPELSLGLIPGAGGTVSLVRRFGRHRTAWLALTGRSLGADDAQAWGLVDRVTTTG